MSAENDRQHSGVDLEPPGGSAKASVCPSSPRTRPAWLIEGHSLACRLGNQPFADTTLSKAELRKSGLMRRESLEPEARIKFASRLASVGLQLVSDYERAFGLPTTSLYSAIGSEPDTVPLARALHARGVPLVLPVDYSSGAPLVYRRWVHGDPWLQVRSGFPSPCKAWTRSNLMSFSCRWPYSTGAGVDSATARATSIAPSGP